MRTLNEETLNRIEQYVKEYQQEHGLSPSYRQILHTLKMSSLNLVQRYVLALERSNRIVRTNLGNIEVPQRLKRGEIVQTPLVGQIACGQPTFAEENIEETHALPQSLFGNGKLFMLRAFGDSMIDAGIRQGDLIVLRQQNSAENGDIVVALVDGKNTLKRFYKKGKKVFKQFCNGKTRVTNIVGFAKRQFAKKVRVLAEKEIDTNNQETYRYKNPYGFYYDLRMEYVENHVLLLKSGKRYVIAYYSFMKNRNMKMNLRRTVGRI